MEFSTKTKISTDFISTKLLCLGSSGFCFFKYLEAKKIDDLYTEAWFLVAIFSLIGFVYFYSKPKVYFDNSNLYIKRINKNEIQIPLKNIHSIFRDPFRSGNGTCFYEIEYLSEDNEDEKAKFHSDSFSLMDNFKNLVIKINPSVEIV